MENYGIMLLYKHNLEKAALITIDESGMLVFRCGKGILQVKVYKELMGNIKSTILKETLREKYGLKTLEEVLPEEVQKYEARRISLDINFHGLKIFEHTVLGFPVIALSNNMFEKLEFLDSYDV